MSRESPGFSRVSLEHRCPAQQELNYIKVGASYNASISDLAYAICSATGFRGQIRWDPAKPDGTPKKQLDMSRLTSLGWFADIPLGEGLASTVELFREELAQQLARL